LLPLFNTLATQHPPGIYLNFDGKDDDDEVAHQLPVSERFSFWPPTSGEC